MRPLAQSRTVKVAALAVITTWAARRFGVPAEVVDAMITLMMASIVQFRAEDGQRAKTVEARIVAEVSQAFARGESPSTSKSP